MTLLHTLPASNVVGCGMQLLLSVLSSTYKIQFLAAGSTGEGGGPVTAQQL